MSYAGGGPVRRKCRKCRDVTLLHDMCSRCLFKESEVQRKMKLAKAAKENEIAEWQMKACAIQDRAASFEAGCWIFSALAYLAIWFLN